LGEVPACWVNAFGHFVQRQYVKKLPLSPTNILKNVCAKDLIFIVLIMQHITGISRQKLQMSSLEDKIGTENPVRFVGFLRNILDATKIPIYQ
jgi:HJR/Mrr/RecB family endonuclease